MDMPSWLDLGKIGSLSGILLAIMQYIKTYIPDKWIKLATLGVGVVVALGDCYMSGGTAYPKAAIYGLLAAILADTGYQFLSSKGGRFALPSKPAELPTHTAEGGNVPPEKKG